MKQITTQKVKKNLNKLSNKKTQRYIKIGKTVKIPNIFGNTFFYVFVFLGAILLFDIFGNISTATQVPIGDVINKINEEKVQDLTISGDRVDVLLRDGTKVYTEK